MKAVAQKVKKEVRGYCKRKSMPRYEGDPLKLKNFNADLFLEEASERMPITHFIVTTTSKEGVKFIVNNSPGAISDFKHMAASFKFYLQHPLDYRML